MHDVRWRSYGSNRTMPAEATRAHGHDQTTVLSTQILSLRLPPDRRGPTLMVGLFGHASGLPLLLHAECIRMFTSAKELSTNRTFGVGFEWYEVAATHHGGRVLSPVAGRREHRDHGGVIGGNAPLDRRPNENAASSAGGSGL